MRSAPRLPGFAALAVLSALAGCAAVVDRATDRFAHNLGQAVLDQDDPATVRDGLPAYLLLLDALIHGDPDNTGTLRAAADLYSAYAGSFVSDPKRARMLSARALAYARRAACIDVVALCAVHQARFDAQERAVAALDAGDVAGAYSLAGAWAAWIQARSDDYAAIADVPRVELLLQRIVELAPEHDRGLPWVYLGVLNSLRPEAVGGRPEAGRAAFERALAISAGRNLMAKTLCARHYARLVFDQELHDRLLREVLDADPHADGYTLLNSLAQTQAEELLRGSADYF